MGLRDSVDELREQTTTLRALLLGLFAAYSFGVTLWGIFKGSQGLDLMDYSAEMPRGTTLFNAALRVAATPEGAGTIYYYRFQELSGESTLLVCSNLDATAWTKKLNDSHVESHLYVWPAIPECNGVDLDDLPVTPPPTEVISKIPPMPQGWRWWYHAYDCELTLLDFEGQRDCPNSHVFKVKYVSETRRLIYSVLSGFPLIVDVVFILYAVALKDPQAQAQSPLAIFFKDREEPPDTFNRYTVVALLAELVGLMGNVIACIGSPFARFYLLYLVAAKNFVRLVWEAAKLLLPCLSQSGLLPLN